MTIHNLFNKISKYGKILPAYYIYITPLTNIPIKTALIVPNTQKMTKKALISLDHVDIGSILADI